jgi:hypothetical protein
MHKRKNERVMVMCTSKSDSPKSWDSLTPTALANVRHCTGCNRDVTIGIGLNHLVELGGGGACFAAIFSRSIHIAVGRKTRSDRLRSFTDTL